ncbi:MAG: AAA family ATPase [Kiritimatiellales bacterium]|nr:AAA family ATPase [Kiritimatiellales bacterium]
MDAAARSAIERARVNQERLLAHQPMKIRQYIKQLEIQGRAGLLIGSRGTGKTTWLLRQAAQEHFLYFSADHPALSNIPLYDLIETAFMEGYEGVLVDEIHYAVDWSRQLKAAYDAFPGKRLLASDSSTIVLRKGMADLSRRFPIRTMPLLSFREFLMLRLDVEIPVIDPFNHDPAEMRRIIKDVNVLRYFREYMQGGFRPFFWESPDLYLEKVMNTISKTIEADIPFLVPQLTDNHLRLMNAVVGYLATAKVPRLEINSLCNKWGVGKEKLYQLLEAMQRSHLLRIIRKQNDSKMHSAGAKILLYEPSVYGFFSQNRGTAREAYVASAFAEAGTPVFAASREVDSDFLVGRRTIEVGGAGKSRKQADFVVRDDTDLPSPGVLPLWLLGLQY